MRKKKTQSPPKLRNLFIEDLGRVSGAAWATTLALGEEAVSSGELDEEPVPPYTTLALGEEGPLGS